MGTESDEHRPPSGLGNRIWQGALFSLAPHPKSGLPDFGTKHVEIGYSRFRLQPKSGVPDFGHSNKRSKSEKSDFDGEGRGEGLLSQARTRTEAPSPARGQTQMPCSSREGEAS